MGNSYTPQQKSALFVTTLTSFMGPFMISSVNVALPQIQIDLGMNAVQLSWIATAYLLAVAVGLLPAGKVADIYGRKKVFILGLVIYTVSVPLAALCQSATSFLALRVLQGGGSALFVATGMAILTAIFPPQLRGRVIGIYVAAVYVGLSAGPLVGGLLTQYLGWRFIFLLILPLGIGSLWLTIVYLKGEWRSEEIQRLDIISCLQYGLFMTMLVYGASILPSPLAIGLVIAALLGLVFFFYKQHNSKFPILETGLFVGNREFTYSSIAALLKYSATFGVTFMMSLYLQYIKGLDPQIAGLVLMSQPVIMAACSPLAGRLSDRIEPRYLVTAGMTMSATGVYYFSRLQPDTSLLLIVANLIFLGAGFALFSSPNMSAMMGAVEKRHYGQASGVVATMRLLGQMNAMAITTVVLALTLGRVAIVRGNYQQFLESLHTIFFISACLCVVGIYFSWYRRSDRVKS